MEVRGRDQISGLPKTVVVSSQEVTQAVQDCLFCVKRTGTACEPGCIRASARREGTSRSAISTIAAAASIGDSIKSRAHPYGASAVHGPAGKSSFRRSESDRQNQSQKAQLSDKHTRTFSSLSSQLFSVCTFPYTAIVAGEGATPRTAESVFSQRRYILTASARWPSLQWQPISR